MKRREFIRVAAAAGGGLGIALMLDGCAEAPPPAPSGAFAPNAWIRLGTDGRLTVMVDRSEMGQGVSTSLPMLVAEELDADWSKVAYEFAPANEAYFNPLIKAQLTGGSTAIVAAWTPLRRAGATARAMLIAAAAKQWGVPAGECRTDAGQVIHAASNRRADYGSLAALAATMPVPRAVELKQPSDFRLIGKSIPRLDLGEKVQGKAVFGIDARPTGALVAVVARCPVFGGRIKNVDGSAARAVAGVKDVVQISSGVAVVADTFWAAKRGRGALKLEWDEGAGASLDDAAIRRELERLIAEGGRRGRTVGSVDTAAPAKTVEARYEVPYLAHATMEPMNCTADVRSDGVTIWASTQFQAGPSYFAGGGARGVAASIAGVSASKVKVVTTHLGGGFGRRSELDVIREATEISKAAKAPVQLVWTREDDIQHDCYRPAALHSLVGGLDANGAVVSWRHRIACQSIIAKFIPGAVPEWATRLAGPLKGGVDSNAIEGAQEIPYAIPNLDVWYARAKLAVPVGFWRSVGHSHTAFVIESFVDELALAANSDPVDFRRRLLGNAPRHRAVLDLAADKASWTVPPPAGRFRGVALHESFGSFVAEVAEVSVEPAGVRVHRVVCAIDCGQVVNPDTVIAQMESGIVYGLSAVLKGRVSINRGRVVQSNFHDYPVLRMNEMPVIEVHLVPSQEPPGGAGEPGTPPIAAAVANAVSRATGTRVRRLPIGLGDPAELPQSSK